MSKQITPFELTADVRSALERKVKELDNFCASNKIPFFAAFAVENTETETKYVNAIRTGTPLGRGLAQDKLISYEKVYRGYSVISPERLPDIELLSPEQADTITEE